ncbi:MAG: hypothetical protein WA828_08710 [Coleofasciculaceae cyanobacterium]
MVKLSKFNYYYSETIPATANAPAIAKIAKEVRAVLNNPQAAPAAAFLVSTACFFAL